MHKICNQVLFATNENFSHSKQHGITTRIVGIIILVLIFEETFMGMTKMCKAFQTIKTN